MSIKNKLIIAIFLVLAATFPVFLLLPAKSKKVLEAASFYESPFSSMAGFPLEAAVDEYKAKYGDEDIKLHQDVTIAEYEEWISAKVLNGDEPDVFLMTSQLYSELYDKGVMKELVSGKELESFCRERKIDEGFVKKSGYSDKIYAVPVAADFSLMAVNKSLLKAHNLDDISSTWTWSDYQRMCRELSNEGVGYGFDWEDAIYSNGGRIVDYQGKEDYLNSLNVLNAINFVYRLNTSGLKDATLKSFKTGRVTFDRLQAVECINMDFEEEDIGFLPMPAGPQGGNISKAECIYVCIGRHSNNMEKARRFINILLSDKIQAEIANSGYAMPVVSLSKNLIQEETTAKLCELSDKVLPSAFVAHRFRDDKYMFDIIDKRIEDAIAGGVKLENALSELHIEILDFLSKK